MKGIIYNGKMEYREDLPMPERKKGEALVKVTLAGICRTDLEIANGYMNFNGIPGHEFVGVVEEADSKNLIGSRVVGEINCGCDDCEDCRLDNAVHCRSRTVLGIAGRNGTLAEYLVLPEKNLHEVDDSLSDEEAVFAEPLAAAYRVAEHIVVVNKDILVLGDGKLGLLIAQVLAFLKGHVTLAGKHPEKMALIEDANLIIKTLDELKPEKEYSVVVDATGNRDGFNLALSHTKPKGTLILKSTVAKPPEFDLNKIVIDEISVIGSRCGPFEHALTLLSQKLVKVKPLIQKRFSLENGLKAFEEAGKPGALKVLVG